MKRSERHQLKQDEFISTLESATAWFAENQKNVVTLAIVIVGAAALLGGLYVYRTREAETASVLLSGALDQYHGTVGSEDAAAGSGLPNFASYDEKYRTALASFEKLSTDYSGYDAGRHATYYVGLCQADLGELDEAEATLSSLRSGKHDLLYYLASRALAEVKANKKDYAGAAEIYRGLTEDVENPLPNDHLLFALARVEERAGNVEEARQYYERMLAEHPDSQLRGDAMARSEALGLAAKS